MAGIGFELKKMFSKKGLLSVIRAYGYAGVVCTGPMILGISLLLGIRVLAGYGGASRGQIELLNTMVTYTLLISILVTNVFSLVIARYTADQLYMERNDRILPSIFGSVAIMLVTGCIGYGIFLHFSGVILSYQILCLILFGELIIVWTQMNYLTAIKDYQGVFVTFIIAVIVSWIAGYIFIKIGMEIVIAMLLSVCIAYSIMAVMYHYLLIKYFPKGDETSFYFLRWFDKYPQLCFIGLFVSIGLFGHLVIMWTSSINVQVKGLFFSAPRYDIPAIIAFISILITTINFVTSVEVNFYPKYRNYFSLFNDGGSLKDIKQAEKEMSTTLQQELAYTFTKQFFATIVFIIGGTFVLPELSLGVNDDMLGIFRVLCIGYAFYAMGNCIMLIQLYFADNVGALVSVTVFMMVSCVSTFIMRNWSILYCGIGFTIGSFAFLIVSLVMMNRYLDKIMYRILCSQPIVTEEHRGIMTKISEEMEERYKEKYPDTVNNEWLENDGEAK